MDIIAVIVEVLPEDCGKCEIYIETPHLTVCGATKRLTCGGYGIPEWCPLMTAEQFVEQDWIRRNMVRYQAMKDTGEL